MAVTGKPAKKAAKVAPPARTAGRGRARTAAAPAAEVEEQAVEAAAAVPRRPRASPNRAAAKAAAAMRGTPPPEPQPEPEAAAEPETAEPTPAAEPELQEAGQDEKDWAPVTFKGRKMMVKLPTSEQLTIYRRLSREFQSLVRTGQADNMALDEALRQLDRATRLVQSILALEDDREWLEDQLLEGRVKMAECSELLKEAFVRLNAQHEEQAAANENRAGRRARARLATD